MFGWEFPPVMAGGLGVACQGLTRSLAKENLNINLILPRTSGQEKEEGFHIFGADHWEEQILTKIREYEIESLQTIKINPAVSNPYSTEASPFDFNILSKKALKEITNTKNKQKKSTKQAIQIYGDDLMEEVYKYNQIAGSIAINLNTDVIHCHDWLTIGAGITAKQKSGKPLVVHMHCTEFDRCPGYGNEKVHELEKAGCEYADRVVAVSDLTKQILVNKYGINPHKIEVVHNGIDMDSSFPEPKGFEKDNPKILFLGRVTYQKGPNYFLEAAARVLKHKPNAEFIFAGKGDMLDYLKGRAVELGIADNINFLGGVSVDKVKEIYRSVDCFILSSVSEPFGLTVLEALSQRVPTIVSKQSGASEVLRHILKYDYWDVDKLTSLILSVITYQPLSQILKEKSVDDVQHLTWAKAAREVNSIYTQLAS